MKLNYFFLSLLLAAFTLQASAQNASQRDKLLELSAQLKIKSQTEKAEALRIANEKGWPIRTEEPDGRVTELMRLDENGMPLYNTTYNAEGASVINSDELYTGGAAGLDLSGAGQTLGEWDGGGVLTTHNELIGRVTQGDGPIATHWHSTHVAGTMIASGAWDQAKGMSYGANLSAYDWNDAESEMTLEAAGGMKVSQHSYGLTTGWSYNGADWYWYGNTSISETEDYNWGFYDSYSNAWDVIAHNAPNYLIVKSAGNDRGEGPASGSSHFYWNGSAWTPSVTARDVDGGISGYDCIGHRGVGKNILTVGAVTAAGAMSSFSGWGPTDDGRIKPDIVAKGVSVLSSHSDGDDQYSYSNGTSMSGPMVSGSVGLLLEHQENLHTGVSLRSATIKGLIIHTGSDLGIPGPDYQNGWGMMDTEAAAAIMTDQATLPIHIYENTLIDGQNLTMQVEAKGGEPLQATVIWNDVPGTPVTPALNPTNLMLVNDLDMRITAPNSTVSSPYILDPTNPANAATTGDNFRDNVEVIYIASPTAGEKYDLDITHKGSLSGGSQDYTLIVTGNTSLSGNTTTLPYAETFDTDLGECYTYSISGDTKEWHWYEFESNGFAKMSGFDSGETEEDWLILPGINADDYTTITMNFDTEYNYGTDDADNYLKLYYSTDYSGTGNPETATWTELTFNRPSTGNYTTENSGDIDLSGIAGQFYLGFKYRGTDGNYRTWQIDNINIYQELITFYFRGPNWMDNNPHNPEVWGPFNGWSTGTMTYDNTLEWWKTTVQVADAAAEITYQSRFAQSGTTKYQKAFEDYDANPSFTTTTGEIWIDASDNLSFSWSGDNFYLAQDKITETQPVTTEPANHVTNIAATADSDSQISLSWTDSDAAFYLVKGSSVGYADISAPLDGTAVSDGALVKNVGSTIQAVSFSGLANGTTYYFKIFPYNGAGSTINYKTDGTVPQVSETTASGPGYYYAGIEGDGETKGAYASGTVTISDVQWDLTEALIGTSSSDYKTGARSVRFNGKAASSMTMLEDKANGIGSIYFNYRRYGTDPQVDWKVEYSTDGGSNWTQIGNVFTAPASDEVQTFHEKVNVDGNIRLRIKRETETGTSNRRLNMDDIIITDYNKVTFLADMSLAAGFDVETDDVYISGTLLSPVWGEPGSNSNALFSRLGPTNTWINVMNLSELQYQYKLFKNTSWNNGEWDDAPNRQRTVSQGEIIVDLFSYIEFSGVGTVSSLSNWNATAIPSDRNILINGAAQLDQNMLAQALIIDKGASLSIRPTKQLTVNTELTNHAGSDALVLQSDATGTASLLHNTGDVPATIQRYINGGGYHFVSVPISGSLTAGLFMNSYLYYYDATADPQAWASVGDDPLTNITNNQGYMIWYTGENTTYDFSGNLINGAFTTATPSSGAAQYQYNLVPNPYPSAIDWDAGSGWTKTNLNSAIYIWSRALADVDNPNGQYASYVFGAATNTASQFIPVGQSFFVETDGNGPPVLEMNNAVRVHSDQAFYKSSQQLPDLMRIIAITENGDDEIVVRLLEDATPEFDPAYDASKLFGSETLPQLYSLTTDERMLSINSIALEEGASVIPVGFEWPINGEVKLSFTELESFNTNITIFLEDMLTGEMINLQEQQVYAFIHDESNDALRFRLHFMDVVNVNEQQFSSYKIWSYDNKVYVSIPALSGEKALIQLIDLQGKIVYQGEHLLNNPEIIAISSTQQLLIARVITGTQVFTQKVFIR